jgi:multisubunit Na+/H+ antiporter MnhB subunit
MAVSDILEAGIVQNRKPAVEQIRKLAVQSIRRDCVGAAGFILCLMFGLFPYPDVALRTGAVFTAIIAIALTILAARMPPRNYRQTEIWRSLERSPGVPESHAGRVINSILAEEYRRHAEYAGWVAAGLWIAGTYLAYA